MSNRKSKRSAGRKAKPGCAARTGSASESAMLDFVGLHVNEINTLCYTWGKCHVEVIYYEYEDELKIIRRRGKTEIEAFRKCVKGAMQRMPNDELKHRRE